nr:PREDICTED: uncharacterized protein LOC103980173 [Musa acuminata subsp. malaccensis]
MLEKKRWILGLPMYSYSSVGHLVVVAEQHTHIYREVAERGLAYQYGEERAGRYCLEAAWEWRSPRSGDWFSSLAISSLPKIVSRDPYQNPIGSSESTPRAHPLSWIVLNIDAKPYTDLATGNADPDFSRAFRSPINMFGMHVEEWQGMSSECMSKLGTRHFMICDLFFLQHLYGAFIYDDNFFCLNKREMLLWYWKSVGLLHGAFIYGDNFFSV